MKLKANSSSRAPERGWLDRLIDFLLGPSTHPVYMASAGAGFAGPMRHAPPRPVARGRINDSQSAYVTLAASGFGSYGVQEEGSGRG